MKPTPFASSAVVAASTEVAEGVLVGRLRTFSRIASALALGLGLLVLVGWAAHLSVLTSVVPGLSTMKPNTAVSFVLCGASLWFRLTMTSRVGRAVANTLAAIVLIIVSVTLFEYAAGRSVGIDQFLFGDDLSTTGVPGRMGPNTAVCFVLVAIAILLGDSWPLMTQVLALTSSSVAMIAVVGYAYSVQALYGIASYTQMAIHTAIGLAVLGLGTAVAHPRSGVMRVVTSSGPGGALTRTMLPVVIIVPTLLGWFRLFGQQARWYGTEFGVAVFAMANALVFAVVMWLFAVRLERSRNQAQQYLDTASVILLALDMQGRITLVNRYACSILGRTADELLGRDWVETCLPARIRDELRKKFHNLIGGDFSVVENPVLTKSGDERLIEWRNTLLRDDEGHVIGTFSSGADITERTRAQEKLRLQSAALNAAANAILITDRAGLVQWSNPAFSELTGYTAVEAVGMNPRDLVKSDQHNQAFYKNLWDTILAGQVWRGEMINRRKDHSLYTEEQTITPVRDGQGAITHFIAVKQDTTERNRVGEEVRQRAQLSALGAAVGVSLTEADSLAEALHRCAEALVTHLGAAFARVWTLNQSENMLELQASAGLYTHLNGPHGKVPLGQFKIGRIAQDRKPHLTNTIIGDPEVSDQEWARQEGMVAFAGHPLIVGDRVVGVMALFARHALSDAAMSALTSVADHIALGIERHRSAEALRTAEERMRFALQSADVGIWDMDYKTGKLQWSETIEAQYGLEPGTFSGSFEAFVERIHPDDRESVLETVGKATKSGADFSVQNRALWPDGTIRWLTGAGRVHLGEHGEPVRGVGISLDVTERHTLEQQYRQAQKMEAIGQLAGGVAHDFNNLLTAILGYAGLLAEEFAVGDPKRADIEEIRKAGERAAGLTRQLLAFSRQQVMQSTILDLNGLTNNLANMLRRLIGEHIELNLMLSSDLGSVKADPGQLEQVIMNLAVNARDAMALGGRLTVETANIELDDAYGKSHGIAPFSAGSFVMLAVSDTGIGMDEVTKRRIFEPFFTTKPRDQGTGLGLATVYGIVKQSGGYVWVYSEPGQGTTFKIYLPRIDEPAAALSEADVSKEVIDRGSETILLVEDEESVRVLSRTLLERDGYRVLEAANPQEALTTISGYAEPIDLLLTDVIMPGESGPELFRHLRVVRPETRVLYISGYADQAIVSRGVLEAGVPFLQKPFSAAALARKVREVLDSGRGARSDSA